MKQKIMLVCLALLLCFSVAMGEETIAPPQEDGLVELTEEEKAQARKDALKAYQEEEMRKIQQRHSRPKPTAKAVQNTQTELSLFDF